MNIKTMNVKTIFAVLVMAGFLALQTTAVFAQMNKIKSSELSGRINEIQSSQQSNDITGSWRVTVNPPGGAPSFIGLITFNKDGGLIASAQGDILLNDQSLATAGHGAWEKMGSRRYAFTFIQIIYGAAGDYQGEAKIRHSVTLDQRGNSWSGQLQVEIFDADGNVVFTGSGTEQATRIVVEPLMP